MYMFLVIAYMLVNFISLKNKNNFTVSNNLVTVMVFINSSSIVNSLCLGPISRDWAWRFMPVMRVRQFSQDRDRDRSRNIIDVAEERQLRIRPRL